MRKRSISDDGIAAGRERIAQRAAVVLAVVAFAGCAPSGAGDPDGASVAKVQSALTGPAISQFFLLTSGNVSLGDRTSESGGNIGIAAGTSAPANTFSTGIAVRTAAGNVILAPHISLGARTVVGNVETNQLDATGATTGTRSAFVAPPIGPVPGPVEPGTVPLTVAMGTSVTLSSGQYGAVDVKGTLNLTGGLYQFASLLLENDARLIGQSSTIVKISGGLTALDRAHLAPAAPLHAQDMRLEVSGTADSAGNSVKLGNDFSATALVVARLGVLTGDRFIASGAIAARSAAVGHDSVLTFDGGFACSSDADCSVDAACVAGTCADHGPVSCQASNIARVPVDPGQPFDLVRDASRYYWIDSAVGAIKSVALDGTSLQTILSGQPGLSGLAVDEAQLYFSDVLQRSVARVIKSGGTPEVIAASQRAPRFLVSDGDHLFWTNQGTGHADGSVRQYTKSTGKLDVVADNQPGPWTLASLSGRVYWSDVVAGTVSSRGLLTEPIQSVASGLLQPAVANSGSSSPHFISYDGRLFDYDPTAQRVAPRASFAAGAFSLAGNQAALYWTNGVRQTVSAQASSVEYATTVWRRTASVQPRVIRMASGAIVFAVATTSGPGSIFTFVPDSATTVLPGSPACPPAGQSSACNQTASVIIPKLECVAQTADNRLVAHFGYQNLDHTTRRVGVGPENQIDRADIDACQPTTFGPGTHHDVFAVGFVDEVTWVVGSHTATASRSSARCAAGAVRNVQVNP